MNKFALLICAVFVVSACKTRKVMVKKETEGSISPVVKAASGRDIFLQHADSANLDFATFNAKGKAEIELNGSRHSVTINIRIKKDQIIWAYFNLGFIPLGSALITPDSIKVLNMIQGGYIHKDFGFIRQYSSPSVDFKTLQALLVGNKPGAFIDATSVLAMVGDAYRITGQEQDINSTLDFTPHFRPSEIQLANPGKKQDLHVKYADPIDLGGRAVPQTIQINSHAADKSLSLNLSYRKITLNEELEYPFNAPTGN